MIKRCESKKVQVNWDNLLESKMCLSADYLNTFCNRAVTISKNEMICRKIFSSYTITSFCLSGRSYREKAIVKYGKINSEQHDQKNRMFWDPGLTENDSSQHTNNKNNKQRRKHMYWSSPKAITGKMEQQCEVAVSEAIAAKCESKFIPKMSLTKCKRLEASVRKTKCENELAVSEAKTAEHESEVDLSEAEVAEYEGEAANIEAVAEYESEVADTEAEAAERESEATETELEAVEREEAVVALKAAEREMAVVELEAAEREAAVIELEAAEREADVGISSDKFGL
jgi:hypothetical protein